ncbi:MAG: tetratricopeptide repeat protein, partial [Pyrinomonadaceae bacterium]
AERSLAQGKLRAAINEYKRVVESDPKDFNTLNMLGDLYAKSSDTNEAVNCFNQVAEYYGQQGFAQKAIAIYNKISRLSPESTEISAKLAELYHSKGSIAEARSHYTSLAEQYQRKGNKAEALSVFKQIAQIDPHNSEIFLKIADNYVRENLPDEAATAFIEAGLRLSGKKLYEQAITSFNKGLDIRPNDLTGLKGIVKAQINLGYTDEAAKTLEKVLENEPHNREVIFLLVDCYLDTDNPQEAERIVIQLVEREPANYPKFLDVVQNYLKINDLDSAARLLAITSEHLLAGGQAKEFEKWINEILARKSEQLAGLRLLVRLHGWQRDESELKEALERLVEAAHQNESVEDERYALTQLVIMLPFESAYAERLQEIKETYGYAEVAIDVNPPKSEDSAEETTFFESSNLPLSEESVTFDVDDINTNNFEESQEDTENLIVNSEDYVLESSNGSGRSISDENGLEFVEDVQTAEIIEDKVGENQLENPVEEPKKKVKKKLDSFEKAQLEQELESAEFYFNQEYYDLAGKTLDVLENQFGNCAEIKKLRQKVDAAVSGEGSAAEKIEEINFSDIQAEVESFSEVDAEEFKKAPKEFDILDDFRSELGLEENEPAVNNNDDFETHYQLGIAYKEMGLIEDSIREFQDAVKLSDPNDGTQRFFLSCNLLGHCFMDKQTPNLAVMWYKRCLETVNLNADERQGLRYEVANAYEAGGDSQKAIEYFEKIYVENVDYRDVGERLENLR